jgi:hypothetical protein
MTPLVNQNSLTFVLPGSSTPFRILFRERQLLKDMPLVFLMLFLTEFSRRRWTTHILLCALHRPLWSKGRRRCMCRIVTDLKCYWRLLRTALATFLVVFKVNTTRLAWHNHIDGPARYGGRLKTQNKCLDLIIVQNRRLNLLCEKFTLDSFLMADVLHKWTVDYLTAPCYICGFSPYFGCGK